MASDYPYHEEPRPSARRWPWSLLLLLLAFCGGAAAMGYALTHWRQAARFLQIAPVEQPAQPTPLPARIVAVTPDPAVAAALDRRVAELETRIARVDARADAAEDNADRAEALLIAFAARRALDRGVALGYLEGLLRQRFGTGQPQAVATIIAAGQKPVTLEDLQAGLSHIAPALAGSAPGESWWDGVQRELAELIVVRKANTPSPAAQDRLARARRQLEAGHVGAALAEVARMPGRERAADWIAAARRYDAARDALDTIETAALLEPRAKQ